LNEIARRDGDSGLAGESGEFGLDVWPKDELGRELGQL
jgi:hypothetical protein